MPTHTPRHWFHWFFYGCLYLLYVAALFLLADISNIGSAPRTFLRLLLAAFELGVVALAGLWLLRRWLRTRHVWWWALYVLLAAGACLVYVVQVYSLWLSNNFISVLALQNTAYSKFTLAHSAIASIVAALIWIVLLAVYGWRGTFFNGRITGAPLAKRLSRKASVAVLVACIVLYAGLLSQQRKAISLEPSVRQTPIASMLANYWVLRRGQRVASTAPTSLADTEACFADPHAGSIAGYPFQKDTVYQNPLPFAKVPGAPAHPNVIIIFTEGLSARNLDPYGERWPGLTPNIANLARHSMKVADYYNQTAATYRGLVGQNSSGFSFNGGAGQGGWAEGNAKKLSTIERQTLAKILHHHGYATRFMEPEHAHDGTGFWTMLHSLGFRHVINFNRIAKLVDGKVTIQPSTDQVDDRTLFHGLVAYLKQRQQRPRNKPLFLGVYNIGTHAFIPMATDGEVYAPHPNRYLNKVHSYDEALGYFINYFLASPYAKNTILVFTTDHATYPDKVYREIAGKNLAPYFVDRVPLLIHDPTHVLPPTFNAHARNSLTLAPTVLQLLGIQKAPNSFLGASLFEPRHFKVGLSALGSDFYVTLPDGVSSIWTAPTKVTTLALCERNVVDTYYQLEATNRLFRPANAATTHRQDAHLTTFVATPPTPPPPPLGRPLCWLDTLNGRSIRHNGGSVNIPPNRTSSFTGWFVNARHDAQPRMQLVLTPRNGRKAITFQVARTHIKRTDVALALRTASALYSGFHATIDTHGLAPGLYRTGARSDNGTLRSACTFDVTFRIAASQSR